MARHRVCSRLNPHWHWQSQCHHPELPWWFVISLIVLTCLTYISSRWYGQKIFAAVDEKTAVREVGTASIIVFLHYASVQLAASFLATTIDPLDDAQLAVPTMIQRWLPIGFRGVGYAVLFAVATTTLAGVWSAMVAMLVSDFTSGWTENIQVQRLMTGVLAVFSWLGSNLLVDNILNKLILANIPIAALSFALLGGFHWSRTNRIGAWVSISIGTIWGTFCFPYWGDLRNRAHFWQRNRCVADVSGRRSSHNFMNEGSHGINLLGHLARLQSTLSTLLQRFRTRSAGAGP